MVRRLRFADEADGVSPEEEAAFRRARAFLHRARSVTGGDEEEERAFDPSEQIAVDSDDEGDGGFDGGRGGEEERREDGGEGGAGWEGDAEEGPVTRRRLARRLSEDDFVDGEEESAERGLDPEFLDDLECRFSPDGSESGVTTATEDQEEGRSSVPPSPFGGASKPTPTTPGALNRQNRIRARPFSWRKLWEFSGPGLLMSIAYLDTGTINTDLETGAQSGYTLLWVLFWTNCMSLLLQLLSARVGVATGCHLAELCRMEYPRPVSIALWLLAELAVLLSDIQEVMASAVAITILSGGYIPPWVSVLVTFFNGFFLLLLEVLGVRYLEIISGAFITTIFVFFARLAVRAQPDYGHIVRGLLFPHLPMRHMSTALSLVGSSIIPQNVFLHSALVQSRRLSERDTLHVREALFYYSLETTLLMATAFVVNVLVVAVFARLFFGLKGADAIGVDNAAPYLSKVFEGTNFPVENVWAIWMLAAGQSSIFTGTYSGQFIMSGFLNLHVRKWVRVLLTRSVSIIPALAVTLTFHASHNTPPSPAPPAVAPSPSLGSVGMGMFPPPTLNSSSYHIAAATAAAATEAGAGFRNRNVLHRSPDAEVLARLGLGTRSRLNLTDPDRLLLLHHRGHHQLQHRHNEQRHDEKSSQMRAQGDLPSFSRSTLSSPSHTPQAQRTSPRERRLLLRRMKGPYRDDLFSSYEQSSPRLPSLSDKKPLQASKVDDWDQWQHWHLHQQQPRRQQQQHGQHLQQHLPQRHQQQAQLQQRQQQHRLLQQQHDRVQILSKKSAAGVAADVDGMWMLPPLHASAQRMVVEHASAEPMVMNDASAERMLEQHAADGHDGSNDGSRVYGNGDGSGGLDGRGGPDAEVEGDGGGIPPAGRGGRMRRGMVEGDGDGCGERMGHHDKNIWTVSRHGMSGSGCSDLSDERSIDREEGEETEGQEMLKAEEGKRRRRRRRRQPHISFPVGNDTPSSLKISEGREGEEDEDEEEGFGELRDWVEVLTFLPIPFAAVPLLKAASSPEIMGPFAIGTKTKVAAYGSVFLVVAASGAELYSFCRKTLPSSWPVEEVLLPAAVAYIAAVLYLITASRLSERSQQSQQIITARRSASMRGNVRGIDWVRKSVNEQEEEKKFSLPRTLTLN